MNYKNFITLLLENILWVVWGQGEVLQKFLVLLAKTFVC